MPDLTSIPGVLQGDLRLGRCALEVEPLGSATRLEDAWAWLPGAGQGTVVLSDDIVRYSPDARRGLLVEAEVADGSETVVVRMDGATWRAWRWRESPGESHRYVERAFLSSEPGQGEPPHLVYRHYWELQEDDGIPVWRPFGARFCGFEEEDQR